MYKFAVFCDECNELISCNFDTKLEVIKWLRSIGGYSCQGIHLCKMCNNQTNRSKHLHMKRDRF